MTAVVFDKTGTLTVGKPAVVSDVLFSSISLEDFCDAVISVEVSAYVLHAIFYRRSYGLRCNLKEVFMPVHRDLAKVIKILQVKLTLKSRIIL